MSTGRLSRMMLVAGTLSIATGGCGSSGSGTGGTTGSGGGSGGALVGTGGTTGSGGSVVTGGTTGVGGSTVQPGTGGRTTVVTGTGGSDTGPGTGGRTSAGSGGSSPQGTGGKVGAGGVVGTGGGNPGGAVGATGGAGQAGQTGAGGRGTGGATAPSGTGGSTTPSTGSGTCTASKAASGNASGSGTHKVTVETNSDPGIKEGTIYRPTDLAGTEKYPIFVWGEGGCSQNGSSNSVAMAEIASHGYFVIADGTPGASTSRSMDSSNPTAMGKPLLAYVDWAIAENEKPCSAYYHSLDTTKIGANGFSCGGLMAEGTAGDPRMTTWGLNSSGLFGANAAFYKTIHTPVLIVLGGTSDMAYTNGERDYDNISALGVPIMLFSKDLGHGGDLFSSRGGDFTKIDLAWLNWWLKGDEGATGKGVLVGSGCTYCTNSAWEVKSKNLP